MKCISCNSTSTSVVDSRHTLFFTKRRRECGECSERFTTLELSLTFLLPLIEMGIATDNFVGGFPKKNHFNETIDLLKVCIPRIKKDKGDG